MNKKIIFPAVLISGLYLLFLAGCSKDEDTIAPVISLAGGNNVIYSLPSTAGGAGTWIDPGFSANDDKDGALTSVSVSGAASVNLNRKGTYTVTYSVSDKAGNSSTETRTINVVNDAEAFAGTYAHSIDTCTATPSGAVNPSPVVTTSDSVNNLVSIDNFGGFNNSGTGFRTKIEVTFAGASVGSAITGAVGAAQGLGGSAYLSQIYPAPASSVVSGAPSTAFVIKYQWTDGGTNDVCITTYNR